MNHGAPYMEQKNREAASRPDNLSPEMRMVLEGSESIETGKLKDLFYSVLAARGDLNDDMCNDLSNRFGRLPHGRARAGIY